jgi:hypothetical protein
MGDPLSVTASVLTVVKFAKETASYIQQVRDAPKERTACAREIRILNIYLESLERLVKETQASDPTEERWLSHIHTLAMEDGALEQYSQALKELRAKFKGSKHHSTFIQSLRWTHIKADIDTIRLRMERLRSTVLASLAMDHL